MALDPKYLNARPLDIFLTSTDRRVTNAVDQIFADAYGTRKNIRRVETKNALRVWLLNFLENYRQDPSRYIRYSRNKNFYTLLKGRLKKNPNSVTCKMIDVATDLLDAGLVEHEMGGGANTDLFQSRIKPTAAFVKTYIDAYGLCNLAVSTHSDSPLISIKEKPKDRQGNNVHSHAMRWDARKKKNFPKKRLKEEEKLLTRYNALLAQTKINMPEGIALPYNYAQKRVFRSYVMYANSDFPMSGRFYGGWWTAAKKAHRSLVQINGSKTVELDYKAQHPHFMYAYCTGKHMSDYLGRGADPYLIPKADGSGNYERGLAKDVFMLCMNASSEARLRQTLKDGTYDNHYQDGYAHALLHETDDLRRAEIRRKLALVENRAAFDAFMGQFEKVHHAIKPDFYKAHWEMFQTYDAKICAYVIEDLTLRGIPVLTIHDSFIVEDRNEQALRQAMTDAYANLSASGALRGDALPPITG